VHTVITVEKSDSSTQFDYRFATQGDSSGSLSFWDTWNRNAVTSDEWQKDGFACKPLQRTTIEGLSMDWSYDECVAGISVADASTVTTVPKHFEDHFDYTFVSGGVISFYDDAYDSSVLQKTNAATDDWKRDGYACYPEPPYDNTYNLRYNFSECALAFLPPSSDTIDLETLAYYPGQATDKLNGVSYPFGKESQLYMPYNLGQTIYDRLALLRNTCRSKIVLLTGTEKTVTNFRVNEIYLEPSSYHPTRVFKAQIFYDDCNSMSWAYDDIAFDEAIDAWESLVSTPADQYGNFGTDVICPYFKLNGNGFRCFDKPKPPASKELAIERYASEYPSATICDPLKQNNPFQCTPIDTPPATKELAIERYTSTYAPETICPSQAEQPVSVHAQR
jgi:hypothetical protein